MAIATKKASAAASSRAGNPAPASSLLVHPLLRGIDAIYRFLASLKLAVFSLLTLAASLAFATFIESSHGTSAAQDYVYRSTWFALLLAFLAVNILSAALIRFPWKKRQTGFVITHAGLLVLIFGSYWSMRTADEGFVAMLEGETRSELVRRNDPVIRVRELDPHTQEPGPSYEMHFQPGPFPWGEGEPHLRTLLDIALNAVSGGRFPAPSRTGELLSQPGDPFTLAVRKHLPASTAAVLHQADPAGQPMARIRLQFKAPGMPQAREALPLEKDQWFKLDRRFYRAARDVNPALLAFSYVDRPELVEDFLRPPQGAGSSGVARFRYQKSDGQTGVFDLAMEGQEGKSVQLPGSDLTVKVEKLAEFPTSEGGLSGVLGEPSMPVGMFQVRKGNGPEVEHFAMGSLPMVPNVMPNPREPEARPPVPLVSIHLMVPPVIDPRTNGRFGQIEVLAGPDHSLYYRVFGRGKDGKTELRSSGTVVPDKPIAAFGGGANMPMTISFLVDDYLPAGVEKQIFEPLFLPKNQMEEAVPASLIEMTVGGVTREIWIQRSESPAGPSFKPVPFGDRLFEIAYDVDRRPMGFDLKLDKFEVAFEPGTEQATKFVSNVRLSDPAEGIKDRPHVISMNNPLSHDGYSFYQMRYSAMQDPDTGQRTGQFQSVLQVGIDPGRPIKYAGCVILVLGIFTQFYMRAGVFTDGGRKERERAARAGNTVGTGSTPRMDGKVFEDERL